MTLITSLLYTHKSFANLNLKKMTNPIELLENKLEQIKEVETLCHKCENYSDLREVSRQKQMYITSIYTLKQSLKLK